MADELAELKQELEAIRQEIADTPKGSADLEELQGLESELVETIAELEKQGDTQPKEDLPEEIETKQDSKEEIDASEDSAKADEVAEESKTGSKQDVLVGNDTESPGSLDKATKDEAVIQLQPENKQEVVVVPEPVSKLPPSLPPKTGKEPKSTKRRQENDEIDRILDNSKASWKSFSSGQKPKKSAAKPLGATLGGSIQKPPKRRHF